MKKRSVYDQMVEDLCAYDVGGEQATWGQAREMLTSVLERLAAMDVVDAVNLIAKYRKKVLPAKRTGRRR